MLAPRQTSKLEDHPLSAVRDCLFNTFAATLHAPCRADRDPLITDRTAIYRTYSTHRTAQHNKTSKHLNSPSLPLRTLFNPQMKCSNHKGVACLPLSLSLSVHIPQISFPIFVQQHQLRNKHTCTLYVAFKLCCQQQQQQQHTIRKHTKSGGALTAVSTKIRLKYI